MYLKKFNPIVLEPAIVQIAKKYGHEVLFSCPYNPSDMPFEYLNSYVKLMVKQRCKKHRTISELKDDIRQGFYGGLTRSLRIHKCVNSDMCKGWFSKCEQHMNEEIRNVLKLPNMNIQLLYNENSDFLLYDPFIKIPKRLKSLKALATKFVIIINNENQLFV